MQWICCGILTFIVGVILLSFTPMVGLWICVTGALVICFTLGVQMLNLEEVETDDVV